MRIVWICVALALAGCTLDEGLVAHVHSPDSVDLSRRQNNNGRPRCTGNVEILEIKNSTRTNKIWSHEFKGNSCVHIVKFRTVGVSKNAQNPLNRGTYIAFSGSSYGIDSVKFEIE